MKILLLISNNDENHKNILDFFNTLNYSITKMDLPLTLDYFRNQSFDYIISYNYRYIIKPDIIKLYKDKIINLHISYLPYNRGANPNIWSWINNTPSGVSIHYIDEGIDTGKIIKQKIVNFKDPLSLTLKETYEELHKNIQELFKDNWEKILKKEIEEIEQDKNKGETHYKRDIVSIYLRNGWETKIEDLIKDNTPY